MPPDRRPARRAVKGPSPVIRSKHDAELAKAIYRGTPILIREAPQLENPWSIAFLRMFDMANDSALFRTCDQMQMDGLESQLRESQFSRSLDDIDENQVREILGDDAAEDLQRLRDITRVLEEAGYIQRKGRGYELTPRGMRKIGQKALKDVFSQLKKDHLGLHRLNRTGSGTELIEETKPYEFGDSFHLHMQSVP